MNYKKGFHLVPGDVISVFNSEFKVTENNSKFIKAFDMNNKFLYLEGNKQTEFEIVE